MKTLPGMHIMNRLKSLEAPVILGSDFLQTHFYEGSECTEQQFRMVPGRDKYLRPRTDLTDGTSHLVGGRELVVGPWVEGGVEGKVAVGVAVQGSHAGGAVCAGVGGVDARRVVDCRISRAGGAAVQCVLVHCAAPNKATISTTCFNTEKNRGQCWSNAFSGRPSLLRALSRFFSTLSHSLGILFCNLDTKRICPRA